MTFREKGYFQSRILNLEDRSADSLTCSKNKVGIRKKDQSLLTLPLDFSPASIISILQNTTEHKPSLPTSGRICLWQKIVQANLHANSSITKILYFVSCYSAKDSFLSADTKKQEDVPTKTVIT
jgi:hypothetical protein